MKSCWIVHQGKTMKKRPMLLQIPGHSPCLLTDLDEAPRVQAFLEARGVRFNLRQSAERARFELPNMRPSAVSRLLEWLMFAHC
jgi:hypothetical protein